MRHFLYPAVHDVARIIWLDAKGSLSYDAIRWCRDQEIMVNMLDGYGNLVSTLAAEDAADAKLRRARSTSPRAPGGMW